jgi:hypothetical protein
MRPLTTILLSLLLFQCTDPIKNETTTKVEEGTRITATPPNTKTNAGVLPNAQTNRPTVLADQEELLGYWVGYFKDGTKENNSVQVDEGFYWNRENKINVSINKIENNKVEGHSVVAGNHRPFEGTIKELENSGGYAFEVKEPGDDKYDGTFSFTIVNNRLEGKWKAYKDIEIDRRVYTLEKKTYAYNPDIMLRPSRRYIEWNKSIEIEVEAAYDDEEEEGMAEFYTKNDLGQWVSENYATATDNICEINASNTLLQKETVENLKRGDLRIIRNTIYARHGYSFKSRPLRVFFDAQEWYIPVHADIRADFTTIEKKNIELLLRYEDNAEEYYDRFGRG